MLERIFQKDEKLFFTIYDLSKVIVFASSFFISYLIRFENFDRINQYLNFSIFFFIIYFCVSIYFRKDFFFNLDIFAAFKNDIKYLFFTLILISLFLYLIKTSSDYSRIWLGLFIIFCTIGFIPFKILMNYLYLNLIKSNIFAKNVLIIGNYEDCKEVLTKFSKKPNYHFRAMILLNKTKNIDYLPIQEMNLDENLSSNLVYNQISQIWIIYNFNFERDKVIEHFKFIPIDIRTIVPRSIHNDFFIDIFDGYSFYNTSLSPFYGLKYLLKIFIDFTLSITFLIISLPIIIFFGILVFIEDGRPIFFKQKRYGWDGNLINIYKLRSLKKNSGAFKQVTKDDIRVLKIGKFIRKFSIDELPQLFNIIKGDMSLVGPRPHPIDLDNQYSKKIRGFMQRLRCKPGLTGLAQVNGYRGPTIDEQLMLKRYEHDLNYIKNWSIGLDLKIILKTLFVFLFQKVD